MKNKIKVFLFILFVFVIAGCVTESSLDTNNLKNELLSMGNEHGAFFNSVNISERDNTLNLDFVVTDYVISKSFLNVITLDVSTKTYEIIQNFDYLNITYTDIQNKQVGMIAIPNPVLKNLVDSAKQNNITLYLDNPYRDTFLKLSNIMYDESVPNLIPRSMAKDILNDMNLDNKSTE